MIEKSTLTDAERDLVEGLDELLSDLRSDAPIKMKTVVHRPTQRTESLDPSGDGGKFEEA